MINAFRFGRSPLPSLLTTPHPSQLRLRSSPELRYRQVIGLVTAPEKSPENMDDTKKTAKETGGDIMSHSFGEGYATRSDEEGFGGTYGSNQSIDKTDDDKRAIHENHPDYDKSQGSEVKEKEKARHQTQAGSVPRA